MSAATQLKVEDFSAVISKTQRTPNQISPPRVSPKSQSTSDALAMRVALSDPAESTQSQLADPPAVPTHVVRLSYDGLRFNHSERFDQSQRVWLKLRLGRLDTEKMVVMTAAEVIGSESTKDPLGQKCFDTQVRFIDTTREFQSTLQSHIDDVISKVCGNCREYTYVPGGLTHTAT